MTRHFPPPVFCPSGNNDTPPVSTNTRSISEHRYDEQHEEDSGGWSSQHKNGRLRNIGSRSARNFNFQPDKDHETAIDLNSNQPARKDWTQFEKDLKAGKVNPGSGRGGQVPQEPKTPENTRRKEGGVASTANSPDLRTPTKASSDRWGESPQPTIRKPPTQAPASWHANSKQTWQSSPNNRKTMQKVVVSPLKHSSSMAHHRKGGGKDAGSDSTNERCGRPGLKDMDIGFNVSMSSLAPQLPKRFSSGDSVVSNSATNVVRGHRVYKIESTSKRFHRDSFLPSTFKTGESDAASRSWVRRSDKDLASNTCHHQPSIIQEDDYAEIIPLDRFDEEPSHAISKKNMESLTKMSEESLTGEETNERPKTCNLCDQEKHSEMHSPCAVMLYHFQPCDEENCSDAVEKRSNLVESEDANLVQVDISKVKEWVVDKVPNKKRWSSKNIENYPIWPPVVKVIKFENRNVSGVSVGSGFSDDLTTSEGDFLSSIGDDELSVEAEMALLLPEQQTTYRIRYDGPTNLANLNQIYGLPPVPIHDDRFKPASPAPDHIPHVPTRTGISDYLPKAPRRGSSIDDYDEASMRAEQIVRPKSRPDVWITPLELDQTKNAVWKVKRVWAVEQEDEKEEIHSVPGIDLYSKIKNLVGAPDSPSYSSSPVGGRKENSLEDGVPQRPSRSWHVLSVVERNGKMEDVGEEMEFADDQFEENLHSMAKDAVKEIELNQRALEEAKKRIMMLKSTDPSKTLRQAPKKSRNNENNLASLPNGVKQTMKVIVDIPKTVDPSQQKAASSQNNPSPLPDNTQKNGSNSIPKNSLKKTKKKEKSSPKLTSSLSSNKISPKKSPRKKTTRPPETDDYLDIPPPLSQLSSPKILTSVKSKKKIKSSVIKRLGKGDVETTPRSLRRIHTSNTVADSQSSPKVEVEVTSHSCMEARSPPKKPSPVANPKREKIHASAMVHDSDDSDNDLSPETLKSSTTTTRSKLEAIKLGNNNSLSWWQVGERSAAEEQPVVVPHRGSPRRKNGKRHVS
ncbi:hypothetical protein IV203_031662 [Nitzschia inconspicua]|uniref:Uncharacterized protein n=1 Tax=Nitzschia inconspicua TaxID=303405 RepID=A0A9K3LVQ7_9STRA|nr:hypothetical protein IV203_031662 [Nitzschia inconspicua]